MKCILTAFPGLGKQPSDGFGSLPLEVCLTAERERDEAGDSARGPGHQGIVVNLPGHVRGENPTSGERD